VCGCDKEVSVLDEARRTRNYDHSISIRVTGGDTDRSQRHTEPSVPLSGSKGSL